MRASTFRCCSAPSPSWSARSADWSGSSAPKRRNGDRRRSRFLNRFGVMPLQTFISFVALIAAAVLSRVITRAIHPLLQRYALARPNARSSHRIPTPQGAGIAVIAATLLVATVSAGTVNLSPPLLLFGATMFIALVGAVDDIRRIPLRPRLLLPGSAVAAI